MEKLEFGETAVMEDGKEYVCFGQIEEDGADYVYLVSNSKPLEVRFAKQMVVDNAVQLEIVEDKDLKLRLYELFKMKFGK